MAKNPSVFSSTRDPKVLIEAAVDFAASDQLSDHGVLVAQLNSNAFLSALNTQKEYDTLNAKQLKVAKVIKVLRDSPHVPAKTTLTTLAQGGPFIAENWRRQELLVRALVGVRPATPPAIRYWDQQSQPTAVNRHITIEMLCDNGTDPALALLEKKLIDPVHDRVYRVSWIHAFMLTHRNEPPLLRASERMITTSLPLDLRPVLLETLCDYDARWYPCCYHPNPPSRLPLEEEGKVVLRRICQFSRDNLDLSPTLLLAVKKTLLEIGEPKN